jgi:hypothetical protein
MVSSLLVILSQFSKINGDDVSGSFWVDQNLGVKYFTVMLIFGKMMFNLILHKTYRQEKMTTKLF